MFSSAASGCSLPVIGGLLQSYELDEEIRAMLILGPWGLLSKARDSSSLARITGMNTRHGLKLFGPGTLKNGFWRIYCTGERARRLGLGRLPSTVKNRGDIEEESRYPAAYIVFSKQYIVFKL